MRASPWSCLCLALLAALPPAFAQDAPTAAASAVEADRPGDIGQRWRIEYERSAQTDGEIVLRLWPHNQPPIQVAIPVKQGDTANGLSRTTREILRDTLDKNKFAVEDGQRFVVIAAFNGERRFALELVSNSAEGLAVDLERTGR